MAVERIKSYNDVIKSYKYTNCIKYVTMVCSIEICPLMKCERVIERIKSQQPIINKSFGGSGQTSSSRVVNKPKIDQAKIDEMIKAVDRHT